jgi:hypothetical protein
MFATVPDSSINSCDSWFIFNLLKRNTCFYMNNSIARTYMGRGFQELFVIWLLHCSVTIMLRMLTKLIMLQQGWYSAVNSSLILIRYLSNVHTWAIFFLRHLANMSSMVPSWASTGSGFVSNLGPVSEATPSGGGCLYSYWQLLTFHPISFPSETSLATYMYCSSLYIQPHSYLLYITFRQAVTLFITWQIHSFITSVLHSRPAALGLSCPIHLMPTKPC